MGTEGHLNMGQNNNTIHGPMLAPLVSFALMDIFFIANNFVFTYPFSLLGVITNTANIIVYIQMGFSESSNVNFLTLSVFDFFVSMFSLLSRVLYNPFLRDSSVGPTTMYMAHCLSHAMTVFIGGSAMMQALISTERCVCVVFPLKVKTWLSRQRSLYLTLAVVAYNVVFIIILYADTGPPYDAHPEKLSFYYFSLYVVPSSACYFIVVLTTIFLVIQLRTNQRWRQGISSQSEKNSTREDRLVKTIIAISTLFIICSFPNVAIFITLMAYPRFWYGDPYLGTLIESMFGFSGVAQAISSSVNIFFYYKMSSRFKKVFFDCFPFFCGKDLDSAKAKTSS